jgi:hypothetical protein
MKTTIYVESQQESINVLGRVLEATGDTFDKKKFLVSPRGGN